jgi:hypothetical protein
MARVTRGSQDIFDDWAGNPQHASSDDYACFRNKLKVYFPVADNFAEDWFEQLRDEMNDLFGGSTSFDAEGSWYDSDTGETIIEPVRVIEAAHNCGSRDSVARITAMIRDAAQATNQSAVSIESKNEFHIVPVKIMVAPGAIIRPGDVW